MRKNTEHFRNGCMPHFVRAHMMDREEQNSRTRLPHMHEKELELLYVYEGEGTYTVDGYSHHIAKGDMIICNAGTLHGGEPTKEQPARMYSVEINAVSLNGLPENWLIDEVTVPIVSCGLLSDQIGELMRLIYLLSVGHRQTERICSHLSAAVLLLVYEFILSRQRHEGIPPRSAASALAHRIRQYLDAHYREQLTLHSVGEAIHISEYYLAHVFKAEFDVPPMKYVMHRRIGEAQTLLITTDLPISAIAERVGYDTQSYFNLQFAKNVGMAPGKYRKMHRERGKENAIIQQ